MGTLYVVSTPIGNLADTTHRAVEVLGSVARILAEDTRRTGILLRHWGIATPTVSAHEHNEAARAEQLAAWLAEGDDVALVTDAGTPLISDPGARLVQRALRDGHEVVPVPGASAVLAALAASGLEAVPFTFYGFPPRSGRTRTELLEAVAALAHTAVLYESPNRLAALLRDLERHCGGERPVVVAREITKLHETFFRGTIEDAIAYYREGPPRGEVVVVVGPGGTDRAVAEAVEREARGLAERLLAEGRRPSAVAREITRRLGLPRNQSYQVAHEVSEARG